MEGLAEGGVDLPEFTAVEGDVFGHEIGGGTGTALLAFGDGLDFVFGLVLRVDAGAEDLEEVFLVLLHVSIKVRNKGLEF